MKKPILLFALCLLSLLPILWGESWQRLDSAPATGDFRSILAGPEKDSVLLAASDYQVFERSSAGNWKNLGIQTGASKIQKLVFSKDLPNSLLALTDQKVLRYSFDHHKWNTLYSSRSAKENHFLSFAILPEDPEHWFLGTSEGLMESDDNGRTWFPFLYFHNQPISILRFSSKELFLAAGNKLFRSSDLMTFKEILALSKTSMDLESSTETENVNVIEDSGDETSSAPLMHDLLISETSEAVMWLATSQGVFESRDRGAHWARLPLSGLKQSGLKYLAFSASSQKLFAASERGVYQFDGLLKKWRELYHGISDTKILGLALIKNPVEKLSAVTSHDVWEYPLIPDLPRPLDIQAPSLDLSRYDRITLLEPTANELQQAVVRYADVGNGKIQRWHWSSRIATVLPTFSFGKDLSSSTSLSTTSGKYFQGPDDVTHGWDARVSWDLGDFIWSSAQTSIDSREKMMVELRQDLLAEANRIYFERRRLQLELFTAHAQPESQEQIDRQLRIDELTALLDGMTGGWFSRSPKHGEREKE